MLPSEFPAMLSRLYAQILDCLPPEYKAPDCRQIVAGRCPAISHCNPVNGFLDANGNCTPGLFFVTGDLTRLQEADGTCVTQWGLVVDIYLFLPCNKQCEQNPAFYAGLSWALACCVAALNVSIAIYPNYSSSLPCAKPIISPTVSCLQEGMCRGAKTTITIPL